MKSKRDGVTCALRAFYLWLGVTVVAFDFFVTSLLHLYRSVHPASREVRKAVWTRLTGSRRGRMYTSVHSYECGRVRVNDHICTSSCQCPYVYILLPDLIPHLALPAPRSGGPSLPGKPGFPLPPNPRWFSDRVDILLR